MTLTDSPQTGPASAMGNDIRIKPHHFVDIITALSQPNAEFRPHPYGHAVHTVARRILADPDCRLLMELGADDICSPCEHNIEGLCDDVIDTSYRPKAPRLKREWNLLIDRRWCERLGIAQGDAFTARELCKRIRDRAGDITDIYREIPAERTAARRAKLKQGIRNFLSDDPTPRP